MSRRPSPESQARYAEVGPLGPDFVSRHSLGIPRELQKGADDRIELPPPRLLLITDESGGWMLFRYTERGAYGGDTWHMTLDDALHQAESEYGEAIGNWTEVPDSAVDHLSYALAQIKRSEE